MQEESNQFGIRLRRDGPDVRHFRPLRSLSVLVGTLLVVVGVLLLVPLLTVVILFAIVASDGDANGPGVQSVMVVIGLTALGIVVWLLGVKLIRGKPQTVLFLRRFGFDDAEEFVSHAAARALGRRWRLVTLDDLDTDPVGANRGVRLAARLGRIVVAVVFIWLLYQLFQYATTGAEDVVGQAAEDAIEEADNPIEGLFAALVVGIVVALVVAIVIAGFALVVAVVGAVGVFAFVSNRALRRAERDQWTPVQSEGELSRFIDQTVAARDRLFAPKIAVVRVVDALWRQTVRALVGVSQVVLIDVSDPTENLLWELGELERAPGIELVLVGSGERLEHLVTTGGDEIDRALLGRLTGQSILVYDKNPGRFSRSLRRTLDATLQ